MVACVLLAVTACAHYRPAPLSPDASAARFATRRLDDPGLRAFIDRAQAGPDDAGTATSWDLGRLTLAALYDHPDLLVARAQLATSEAAITTAGELPNPSVTLLGAFQPQSIGYSLTLLFETFGRRGYRVSQARNLANAARWRVTDAAWRIRSNVRAALLAAWAAERRLALANRSVVARQRLVDLQEQRVAEGQASATDLAIERMALVQATLAAGDIGRQRDEARVALAVSVAVPLDALETAKLDFSAFDQPPRVAERDAGAMRRRALTERSDVLGELAAYQASDDALRIEIARQYPNVALSPGYNYDVQYGFELNPTLDLPIFNHNEGPVAEAEARRREAADRFLALQAEVIGQIERAMASYRDATAAAADADRLVDAERGSLRQTERAFQAGAIDRPTLVAGEAEATTIEMARFDAVVRQRQAIGLVEDGLQQALFDQATAAPATTGSDDRRR